MTHTVSLPKTAKPIFGGLDGLNKIVHFVPVHQYDYNKFEEVLLVLVEVGTNAEGNLVDKIYLQGSRKVNYTTHKLTTSDTMDLNVIIQNKLDELNYEQVTFGSQGPAIVRRGVPIGETIKVTSKRVQGNDQPPRYFLGGETLQILKERDNGKVYIANKEAADLERFDRIILPHSLEIIEVIEVTKVTTLAMCIIVFVKDKNKEVDSTKEWLTPEDYKQKAAHDQIEHDIYYRLVFVEAIK